MGVKNFITWSIGETPHDLTLQVATDDLKTRTVEVIEAAPGTFGLTRCSPYVDLILLHFQLPDTTGIQLLGPIKARAVVQLLLTVHFLDHLATIDLQRIQRIN